MPNKRNKFFVDRSVQGAILMRLVLHLSLFLFASCLVLFFVEKLGHAPHNAAFNMLSRHSPTILTLIVLAPIFLRDLCKLTNRFAGPMVRVQRAMRDLAEGREVTPIHFRRHDFWQDFAIDFNRVIERIQSPETHTANVHHSQHRSAKAGAGETINV